MRIGFIGAGKVGYSLGRYLKDHGYSVTGYYSRTPASSEGAAEFTGTGFFSTMEALVQESEVIFLTVPDGAIRSVWEQLKTVQIRDRIICHCSGVLSSEIFSDMDGTGCSGYSIHPLLAVNDKLHSYKEFPNTLFTIEGHPDHLAEMRQMFEGCGNTVVPLDAKNKVRYHAAAVLGSNLVLGLAETAIEELVRCGFSREEARAAMGPFMLANVAHILDHPLEGCLTGPVERCDRGTVEMHLSELDGETREIYRLLSLKAEKIAERKNPDRDYTGLKKILKEEITQ